jgi:signal transduction histidine kinase
MTGFQRDLQIFFYQSFLIVLLVSFGLYSFGQWLLWRFLSQPLHALVETINSFSTDPTIARPLPPYVTQSREFDKAAKAVEQMQRNTLIALRQRERLADIGEAVTKINHDIRNVLSFGNIGDRCPDGVGRPESAPFGTTCRPVTGTGSGSLPVDA